MLNCYESRILFILFKQTLKNYINQTPSGNPLSDVILTALSPSEINAYMIEGAGAAQVKTWEVTNTRTGNVSCTIKRSQRLQDCTDTAALNGENRYSFRGLWAGGSSEPRIWGMSTLNETRKIFLVPRLKSVVCSMIMIFKKN